MLFAGDEGERVDVLMESSQRKFRSRHAPFVEERQGTLIFWLEIVQATRAKRWGRRNPGNTENATSPPDARGKCTPQSGVAWRAVRQ